MFVTGFGVLLEYVEDLQDTFFKCFCRWLVVRRNAFKPLALNHE